MSEPVVPEYLRQSMVKRVARAIADAFMEDYEEAPTLYDEMAGAAIKAMREPNLAMRRVCSFEAAEVTWPAMIDAALAEAGRTTEG